MSSAQFPRPLPRIPGESTEELRAQVPPKRAKVASDIRNGPSLPKGLTEKPQSFGSRAGPVTIPRPLPTPPSTNTNQLKPASAPTTRPRAVAIKGAITWKRSELKSSEQAKPLEASKQKSEKTVRSLLANVPKEPPPTPSLLNRPKLSTDLPPVAAKTAEAAKPLKGGEYVKMLKEKVVSERFKIVKEMLLALEHRDQEITLASGEKQKISVNTCFEAIKRLPIESTTTTNFQIKSEYGIILEAHAELSAAFRKVSPPATRSPSGPSTSESPKAIPNKGGLSVLETNRKRSVGAEKNESENQKRLSNGFVNIIRTVSKEH